MHLRLFYAVKIYLLTYLLYVNVRYDTIWQKSLTRTRKLSIQL